MNRVLSFLTLVVTLTNAFVMRSPSTTNFISTTALQATSSTVKQWKRSDVISKLAKEKGMTKAESEAMLDAVLDIVKQGVQEGNKVVLGSNFGHFAPQERAARMGRNPQTGEPMQIQASVSPKFTPSKAFKQALNPGKTP